MHWDQYHMGICKAVSARSKDESTKLGAVIVGPDNGILSTGYNSFPRGVDDGRADRQVRPTKYKWMVHAEANAIYAGAKMGVRLDGGTLYCRWPPCPVCAAGIIQAGIIEIVVGTLDVPDRWMDDMLIAQQMLAEAGLMMRVAHG